MSQEKLEVQEVKVEEKAHPQEPQEQKPVKALFQRLETLDVKKHINLRWKCLGAECPQSCCYIPVRSSIGFSELEHLSLYFPVMFPLIKTSENEPGRFEMNIFFKLDLDKDGACVYLEDGKGCTLGQDKPIACKQYPFSPFKDPYGRTLLNLDFTCPGWSESEGEKVLMSETALNPYFQEGFVNHGINLLSDFQQSRLFVETLANYNLIKPATYNYRGVNVSLNVVDERALYELPKETLKDFSARGYLRAIYFHLHSLANYKKLIDSYLNRVSSKDGEGSSVFVLG